MAADGLMGMVVVIQRLVVVIAENGSDTMLKY